MSMKARLKKVEGAFRPNGRVVVWHDDSGEPCPKVGPYDRLIKVIYATPPRPSWMKPDHPGYSDDYWGEPGET